MYDITVEDVPAVRVVSEHLEVPSHLSAVTEAATLDGSGHPADAARHGADRPADPVIHHADEQRTSEDACFPYRRRRRGCRVQRRTSPGRPMASATHVGPLDELVCVVNAVRRWATGGARRVERRSGPSCSDPTPVHGASAAAVTRRSRSRTVRLAREDVSDAAARPTSRHRVRLRSRVSPGAPGTKHLGERGPNGPARSAWSGRHDRAQRRGEDWSRAGPSR